MTCINRAAADFLMSIFTASYCDVLPFASCLSDRVPRKHVLAVGIRI